MLRSRTLQDHRGDGAQSPSFWPSRGEWISSIFAVFRSDEGGAGSESDHDLILRAQKGGKEGAAAFEVLVRRHQQWILHLVSCLLGRPREAEDVAQDAFFRAYLALKLFRGDASFRTWMRRIALNEAYSYLRRGQGKFQDVSYDDGLEHVDDQSEDLARRVQARDSIVKVLKGIPHPYREALVLFHVEELSVEEIAGLLDLGPSAVKMRLKRARSQFETRYVTMTGDDQRQQWR